MCAALTADHGWDGFIFLVTSTNGLVVKLDPHATLNCHAALLSAFCGTSPVANMQPSL